MDELLKTLSKDKWQRIGIQRRAGALVPLFSVYSQDSLGIADLRDLRLLIDWVSLSGNSILQLLPMNELGSLFCPYDSLSSFALEPAYLCIRELVAVDNRQPQPGKIAKIKEKFSNHEGYVDYGIKTEKLKLLWEIFLSNPTRGLADFEEFREKNSYWLGDSCLYKALKTDQQGRPWYEWLDEFRERDKKALTDFQNTHQKEILFQAWLQWQLYEQFKAARVYAREKGILLKGDLPILVSRDSADVWQHPEFFKLEFAAGAPPDMYCAKGQRWGMPTYNWERIKEDKYRYIKEKLRYAENFYDILRIDHVVGLFRIWSIPYNEPLENQGLGGFFEPQDESLWRGHGYNILKTMLENTSMLLCAEDLGVIPRACTESLRELGIPGNEVQRWAKDWKERHDFLLPDEYRLLSVAMLSTHDSTCWRTWWQDEAGTVDEGMFLRRCSDHRRIDFSSIKNTLFDLSSCRYGRLRWQEDIDSVDKLVSVLGRRQEELKDFIDIYLDTYQEKEKFLQQLGLPLTLSKSFDTRLLKEALKMTLGSGAIFSIQLITDWLFLSDIFKADPYQYRFNTPGIISQKNWALRMPISLEALLKHKVNKEIRSLIKATGRI